MILKDNFTYIDLFAGIGGFHCAMQRYSPKSKCVMASEIDKSAAKVYHDNYGITPLGDIKQIDGKSIPYYDVLCAGFPCQTFSKAGTQLGFKDPRGTLFYEIVRLIKEKKQNERPKVLILENVKNLITHDSGYTWKTIKRSLKNIGYNVCDKPYVIGPKDLGIPQIRDRAIILAVRKDIYNKKIDLDIVHKRINSTSIDSILEKNISAKEFNKCKLSNEEINVLKCWDEFYSGIKEKTLGFPIWSDEFGEYYSISHLPLWKQGYINKNRELYKNNKKFIDMWMKKWKIRECFTPTNRKFEWQSSIYINSVFEGIIQFRTSGVRIKRPTESPTLVAMNHRPIIGKYKRYITLKEAARLQCFPDNMIFDENESEAYKQLGNAVNVEVIKYIFGEFINYLNLNINS